MANSIKFGPGWVRNNINGDSEILSGHSYSTWSSRCSDKSNLIATGNKTSKMTVGDTIPSYSSVLRGAQLKSTEKEKPSKNVESNKKELGILIQRNYCQRNNGRSATCIRLVDSSVSHKILTKGTSVPKDRECIETKLKDKDVNDDKIGSTSKISGDEKNQPSQTICNNSKNEVGGNDSNCAPIQTQTEINYRGSIKDNDSSTVEDSSQASVKKNIDDEQYEETNNHQIVNKIKSPKSVRWLDEVNSNTSSNELSSKNTVLRSTGETYQVNIPSPEIRNQTTNNSMVEPEWDRHFSSHCEHFQPTMPRKIAGCYMSKEDIEMKLSKSIEKLEINTETLYSKTTELSSYEPWTPTPSRQENNMSMLLHTKKSNTNPFVMPEQHIAMSEQIQPPVNELWYHHKPHFIDQPPTYECWTSSSADCATVPDPSGNSTTVSSPFQSTHSPIMIDPASNHLWFYLDPYGKDQGPFSTTEMTEWYSCSYFDENLLLRRVCDSRYITLGELIRLTGNSLPFLASHLIPPLRNISTLSPGNPFS